MSFMQHDIQFGDWIEIDGPMGIDWIPADVCGHLPDYDEFAAEFAASDRAESEDVDDAYKAAAFEQVKDYTENRECYSISERSGWGARLSAPGYLDCTEWAVFDTFIEASEYLTEMYGDDDDDNDNDNDNDNDEDYNDEDA